MLFMALDTDDACDVFDASELGQLLGAGYTAVVWDTAHDRWFNVATGDWIVKGPEGNFYPMTDTAFAKEYSRVNS